MNEQEPQQNAETEGILKNATDIYEETWVFAHDLNFRDPKNPSIMKSDLEIDDVLKKAGFKEVQFEDIPDELKEAVKTSKSKRLYAYPLNSRNGKQIPGMQIFINKNGNTLYFVNKTRGGFYSWSRLERDENRIKIDAINHDSNIGEVINTIGFFEIQNRQNPVAFPRYAGNDIPIKTPETEASMQTRKQITDRVIGTA